MGKLKFEFRNFWCGMRLCNFRLCAIFLTLLERTNNIPPSPPGEHWVRRFLKNHDEMYKIRQKSIELDRKTAYNPQDLVDWFTRLKRVINEHGIQQEDSYNYDEIGFRIGIGGD